MHTIIRTTFGKNLTMIFYDYINLNMFTHHYMKIKKRKEKKKEKKKTFCVTTDDIHPYDIFSAFITNSHYLSPLGKWTGCPPVTTTCYVICSTYSTRLMPTIRYSIFLHTHAHARHLPQFGGSELFCQIRIRPLVCKINCQQNISKIMKLRGLKTILGSKYYCLQVCCFCLKKGTVQFTFL